MKRNLFLRLCLLMTVMLSLYSCIHDEVYSSSDPSSTEYTNKSLWKQDEKYITNVMKVYAKNEAEIKKVNGIPYWNYATTVDSFDESFVTIPVVDNGKVTSVLKVPRHGKKIYFYYTQDESDLSFFQALVFAKIKKAGMPDGSTAQTNTITCTRQWVSMWYPDDESNPDGPGSWGTPVSIIKCKALKDECLGFINEYGQCDGGNGEGGYTYPGLGGGGGTEPVEEEDPCDKLKAQNQNISFKAKITDLKTKTTNTSESGFRVGNPVPGSGQTETQYQELSNKPGTNELNFKIFSTTYGIMHSHYNGLVAMFSPGDINLFIQLLQNAQANNIPLNQVFISLVTSQGIYQLRGDGIDVASLSMYTDAQIEAFNTVYSEKMGNPNILKTDLQKEFLKFMKANMNIDGAKLYETDSDGKSEQLALNGNNLSTPDCP